MRVEEEVEDHIAGQPEKERTDMDALHHRILGALELGKASVSGYCIKFKTLADIDVGVLESANRAGVAATS